MHKHHVACLDCRVAPYTAHCDADVRAHKHGCVVDAVADKAQYFVFFLVFEHLLDVFNLVLRQKRGFVARKTYFCSNIGCNCLVIPCKHNRFASHFVKLRNGRRRFVLDFVADKKRTDIFIVVGNINDSAYAVVRGKRNIVRFHKFFVTAIYNVVAFCCDNAESRNVCESITSLDFTVITSND